MTSKQKNTGTNSELSLNLNASFTIWPNKKAKIWVQKPRFANFWSFFLISFFDGFFPSASPGSPEATTTASTMRPSRATSRRCGTSSVSIRSACARKIRVIAGGLKVVAELLVPVVLWVPVEGARRNPTFSSLVLTEILTFQICHLPLRRSEGNEHMKLGGRWGIRWVSFRASCNTRHDKISQQKWTLPEGCDVTRAFLCIVRLWDPWELEPGFRQCYHLIDDIVLTGLITIEKAISIIYIFFHQK